MTFLFVGEMPSQRATQIGATWRNGRLSAKTLHTAVRAAGFDPQAQRYTNIFICGRGSLSRWSLWRIRQAKAQGLLVVALGRKVQRALQRAGVCYTPMVHPAARGRIRKTENYMAHVRQVLQALDPVTPW